MIEYKKNKHDTNTLIYQNSMNKKNTYQNLYYTLNII